MFWHFQTGLSPEFAVPSSLPGNVFSIFTVSYIQCTLHYWYFLSLFSPLVRLPMSSAHHTSHILCGAQGVAVNLTPPGLYFIAWCLIHIWNPPPILSQKNTKNKKKYLVSCLFQVLVRQREMTGGGYSPSALPVQETGGIIRRGYRREKSGNVFVYMCANLVIDWWLPVTMSTTTNGLESGYVKHQNIN